MGGPRTLAEPCSDLDRVLDDLRADPLIGPGLPAAFPDSEDPFNLARIADVLSAYERTMVSLDSPYDRWRQGDDSALSAEALRGMELFESDDLACAQCHGGPLQSNATVTDDRDAVFFNTGLYAVYPADARGLYEFTVTDGDFGRFRVPSLRNIAQGGGIQICSCECLSLEKKSLTPLSSRGRSRSQNE